MMEPDVLQTDNEDVPCSYQRLASLPDVPYPQTGSETGKTLAPQFSSFAAGKDGLQSGIGPAYSSPSANKPFNSVTGCFIRISDTERHGDDHVLYVIEVNAKKALRQLAFNNKLNQPEWTIQRRYSDFVLLKTSLESRQPACLIPALPEKFESYVPWRILQQKFDQDFVEFRRQRLEAFLHHLLSHPVLGKEDLLLLFLCEGDGWRSHTEYRDLGKRVTGYVHRHSASVRLNNNNSTLQRLRTTASHMQQNLRALLTSLGHVNSRQQSIIKLHKEYGEALCDWCGHDRQMADGIQTMGHLMDSYSGFVEIGSTYHENVTLSLEDVELEGKLRELVLYTESMFQLARRMELLMLKMEKKETRLQQLRTELETGGTGVGLMSLKNKLMGPSNPRDKEQKIACLKELIAKEQEALESITREFQDFTQTVESELAYFHKERAVELERVIKNHCQVQLTRAKRSLRLWTQCRQGLEDLPTY